MGNEEMGTNLKNFKYNPEDYPYPLNEDMEKVYKAYKEHNTTYLECYIADLHLTLKQAGVNRYFSDEKVREMQNYFWSLLGEMKKEIKSQD